MRNTVVAFVVSSLAAFTGIGPATAVAAQPTPVILSPVDGSVYEGAYEGVVTVDFTGVRTTEHFWILWHNPDLQYRPFAVDTYSTGTIETYEAAADPPIFSFSPQRLTIEDDEGNVVSEVSFTFAPEPADLTPGCLSYAEWYEWMATRYKSVAMAKTHRLFDTSGRVVQRSSLSPVQQYQVRKYKKCDGGRYLAYWDRQQHRNGKWSKWMLGQDRELWDFYD